MEWTTLHTMDSIDKKIISILNADGREANNAIAKRLNVSEGTVRNRIKKLTDAGILKVTGQLNPELIPDKELFLLGVKIASSNNLSTTADTIAEFDEVKSVYITTGRYDLIVEVWLPVKYGLIEFINGPLASVDGIVASESFLAMKSLKKWI